jgi:hypothetical protein
MHSSWPWLTGSRQLAVVRGLVRERTQQLGVNMSTGQEVFTTRRCRNSYGVVVRRLYDETKHEGLAFITDPRSNRRWIPDVIESVHSSKL